MDKEEKDKKYTPPETVVASTSSFQDQISDIAKSVINAEVFKYFKIVMGTIFTVVLGFLISQVVEIKSNYKYLQKIDNFYEVKAQNERLIRENSHLNSKISLLEKQTEILKAGKK